MAIQSPGTYKGVPIRAGTDAEIRAQMAAIDAGQPVGAPAPQVNNDVRKLQMSLGVPVTGVMDAATTNAMTKAVATSLQSNPQYSQAIGPNSPEALATAYNTGNWSGIVSLSGKPFTDADQAEAVAQAETALAPAYEAEKAFDTANVASNLEGQRDQFDNFVEGEAKDFQETKKNLDQNAADQGVLFSGARTQKERDLKTLYEQRQEQQAGITGRNIANTARSFNYKYGNEGANKLSSMYNLSGGNTYNPSVAIGGATPSTSIRNVYNPSQQSFQGTAVTSNKAAVQTRAANMLANRANKLTSTGYKNTF